MIHQVDAILVVQWCRSSTSDAIVMQHSFSAKLELPLLPIGSKIVLARLDWITPTVHEYRAFFDENDRPDGIGVEIVETVYGTPTQEWVTRVIADLAAAGWDHTHCLCLLV